jgi:hypothetical protein
MVATANPLEFPSVIFQDFAESLTGNRLQRSTSTT